MKARHLASIILIAEFVCLRSAVAALSEPQLSFEEALDRIVERDLDVASRRSDLASARISQRAALFSFGPNVSLNAKQSWSSDSSTDARERQLEGTINWNLLRFGADTASYRSSEENVKAKEALLDQAILAAEDKAIQALVADVQYRQELSIYSGRVHTRQRLLETAKKRYGRGLLPIQEANKVIVDLNNASAQLKNAEIKTLEAHAALMSLLGEGNIADDWPWRDRLRESGPRITNLALEISRRPDYRAAKTTFLSETHRQRELFRKILPSVDAALSAGVYGSPGPYERGWIAGLTLSVPLFNGLQNYSAYAIQEQKVATTRYDVEKVERNAHAEWAAAKGACEASIETALGREQNLAISRTLFNDNQQRFNSGRATVNDLVVDQGRLLDSELLAIEGWSQAHLAWARLCHALGRSVRYCN